MRSAFFPKNHDVPCHKKPPQKNVAGPFLYNITLHLQKKPFEMKSRHRADGVKAGSGQIISQPGEGCTAMESIARRTVCAACNDAVREFLQALEKLNTELLEILSLHCSTPRCATTLFRQFEPVRT
jgi:hypothetical protein